MRLIRTAVAGCALVLAWSPAFATISVPGDCSLYDPAGAAPDRAACYSPMSQGTFISQQLGPDNSASRDVYRLLFGDPIGAVGVHSQPNEYTLTNPDAGRYHPSAQANVPEPGSVVLLVTGVTALVGGLAVDRWRRRGR